jgi:hypothetical protein
MSSEKGEKENEHQKKTVLHIDNKPYTTTAEILTGSEIRRLPMPLIGEDFDLFLDVPGAKQDQLIELTTRVEMRSGLHFYTAPRVINPGGNNGIA